MTWVRNRLGGHPGHRRSRLLWTLAFVMVALLMAAMSANQGASSSRRANKVVAATAGGAAVGRGATNAAAPAAAVAPCPPPPLPVETTPPSSSYGIPFVAQISATVVTGYDEYIAAHGVPPNHGDPTPWRSTVTNVTGWASGLLQVPGLTATIAPANLTFCSPGLLPSQGGAILTLLQQQLSTAPWTPPISNNDTTCSPTVESFLDARVTLIPSGTTTLSVAGIEADGSLDLSGSTSASTRFDLYFHACGTPAPPAPNETCIQFAPTTFNLSTRLPAVPSTAPPGVAYTVTPQALHGPLPPPTGAPPPNAASATLVDYAFPVSAFIDPSDGVPGGCAFSLALNAALAGWNNDGPNETNRYPSPPYSPGTQPQVGAPPGWAQVTTTNRMWALGP